MPVVPLETCLLPENLFSCDVLPGCGLERWSVCHTRPRAEKALARQLVRHGIGFFLPLYERSRVLQRRRVRSYVPLFPGYLFLRGTDDDRRTALETNLVAGCLHVEDQDELTSDLARINELIQSGAPLSPEARLQPGMPAEIRGGPLAGLRGTVIKRRGVKTVKFLVEVRLLQQGTSVEVDASMIQPA